MITSKKYLTVLALVLNFTHFSYAESGVITAASTLPASSITVAPNENVGDIYLNAKYDYDKYRLKLDQIINNAEKGNIYALRHLGIIYQNGYGVTKSDVVALMWYTISAEKGLKEAKTDQNYTELYMATDQIRLAHKMARLWISNH